LCQTNKDFKFHEAFSNGLQRACKGLKSEFPISGGKGDPIKVPVKVSEGSLDYNLFTNVKEFTAEAWYGSDPYQGKYGWYEGQEGITFMGVLLADMALGF